MLDETQIVLSELVTNGVLHARTPLGVTISAEAANLEIAVSDGSPAAPTVRSRRDDLARDLDALNSSGLAGVVTDDRDPRLDVGAAGSVVGGRGMQLVASLAAEWGVDRSGSGKSVWARLPTPPAWPPAAGCRCAAGDVRLASGRTVAASFLTRTIQVLVRPVPGDSCPRAEPGGDRTGPSASLALSGSPAAAT